jgi:hypothetical protein
MDLENWVMEELARIADAINALYDGVQDIQHAPPSRPREGMIVVADGTDWNPGSGGGAYEYLGGVWTKL